MEIRSATATERADDLRKSTLLKKVERREDVQKQDRREETEKSRELAEPANSKVGRNLSVRA